MRFRLNLAAFGFTAIGILMATMGLPRTQAQVKHNKAAGENSQGKRIFAASCAACHGLDGRGGERAPNIAGSARLQHLPDSSLSAIVKNGVPGTGMPAFSAFTPAEIRAVVAHLRVLQGQGKMTALPGDAAKGRALFFAKAECSSCHMVRGEGGFIGPDLSTYGGARDGSEILAAITSTVRINDWGYKPATVTKTDGQTISGIVRNEDNFSVQLQSSDGAFHLLQKSELQNLKYEDHPAMPTNYKERLTKAELDDLVSYLISAGKGLLRAPDPPQEDPIEEQ